MTRKSGWYLMLGLVLSTACCSSAERDQIGGIPAGSRSRALQVEAQQTLRQIYTMQQTYYSVHKQFGADFTSLGMKIPSSARYRYQLTARGSSWNCSATANIDQDATVDTWVVDQSGRITCATNDVTS